MGVDVGTINREAAVATRRLVANTTRLATSHRDEESE